MNKSILSILMLVILCIGCSTQKDKAIENLKPVEKYDYNIVVLTDDKVPKPALEYIKEDIKNENDIWRKNKHSIFTTFIKKDNSDDMNYEKIFNITKYPAIMIFNSEKLVLKTNSFKEMKRYFATPITFRGKSENWSVKYTAYIYSRSSETSEYTINYIGDSPTPKYIDYQIGSTKVENGTNTSIDKFPLTRPGGGCSGCAITYKDDQIKVTIEWDGKSDSFTLTSK